MEELKKKILALIGMMDGRRDLDFICLAFCEVPRGDVAIAVLELCLDGKLVIDANGIALPSGPQPGDESPQAAPVPTAPEPQAIAPGPEPEANEGPLATAEAQAPEPQTEEEEGADAPAPAAAQPQEAGTSVEPQPAEGADAPDEPQPQAFEPEVVPDVEYPSAALRASDPVDTLGLSARPSNSLARLGIKTVSELVASLPGLASQPGMGASSFAEIEGALAQHTASFSAPLGRRTAAELRRVSGNRGLSFDAFGTLVAIKVDNDSSGAWANGGAPGIEELGLGDAANRRLGVNGLQTVEDLLATTPQAVATLPHVGDGLMTRIGHAITEYCQANDIDAGAWGKGVGQTADIEALLAAGGAELRQATRTVIEQCAQRNYPTDAGALRVLAAEFAWWQMSLGRSPEEAANLCLARIEGAGALEAICLGALRERCEHALADGSTAPIPVPSAGPWQSAAARLGAVDGVQTSYDPQSHAVSLELKGVREWLDGLDDERGARLVRLRFEGKTLQEVGDAEGLTRERVRQIVDATLHKAGPFEEDRWRALFETYALDQGQFKAITGLDALSFGYLSLTAKTSRSGRAPLVQALEDESVPEQVKRAISDNGVLTGYVYVEGKPFKVGKQNIIRYLLEQRASGPSLTLEEVYDAYLAFLDEHGIEMSSALDPKNIRAVGANIDRFPFAIYAKVPADEKGDRRGIRFYDSKAKDFSPLVEAMNDLAAQRDVEVSAEALMGEPSLVGILASLDIRNGYELHQVLCAWCEGLRGVSLGRAPMVTLGQGDRRRQILDLIAEIGPADANAIADEYAKRYGVRAATFKGSFLNDYEQYCHDGLYTYEVAPLDEGQLASLRAILGQVNGWCPASRVRKTFLGSYPRYAGEPLTPENVERLGFEISGALLVRRGFDLHAEFARMVCEPSSFRLGEGVFAPDVCSNNVFVSELNKAKRQFSVIEVERDGYLSIRALASGRTPLTPEALSDFVNRTIARMVPDRPYSVKSLRALGLMDELDTVRDAHGLSDFFEESILSLGYVGGELKRTSAAFTSLFARTTGSFAVSDVVDWYVQRRGCMSVSQLAGLLEADNGARVSLSNLRFAVQRSSMELDTEHDMVMLPSGMGLLEEGPALLPEEPTAAPAEPAPEGPSETEEQEPGADKPIEDEPTGPRAEEPIEVEGAASVPGQPIAVSEEQEPAPEAPAPVAEEATAAPEEHEDEGTNKSRERQAWSPFHGTLRAAGLAIDGDDDTVTLNGRAIDLTLSEFKVLATLAMAPGKLFTREELCTAVIGDVRYTDVRIIDSHVKNIRAKLGDDAYNPTWIATVHGSGYRFDAEVDASEAQGVNALASAPVEYESADGASRLCIDETGRRVLLDGTELSLTRSEYRLLVALAQHGAEVQARLDLCAVIGIQAHSNAEARTVDSHLKNLRIALADDAKRPTWIGTAHGKGYFFLGKRVVPGNAANATAPEPEGDGLAATSEPEGPEPAPTPVEQTPGAEGLELQGRIEALEGELAQKEAAIAEKERLREEYRELGAKIPELEDEVRSYGFFRRAERQEAQARLDEAKARLDSLRGRGSGMGTLRREAERLRSELDGLKTKLGDQ